MLKPASQPITVAARSKAWTVFARWNAGIVGSNPNQSMDVCVHLFSVCIVLCVGSGLATDWSPIQRILPTVYRIKKLKSCQGPTKGCRAIDIYIKSAKGWDIASLDPSANFFRNISHSGDWLTLVSGFLPSWVRPTLLNLYLISQHYIKIFTNGGKYRIW
jgi:hypothetical protein